MPEKATMERAKEDLREGKAPSTAAGEFVKEEIDHVREGKHGVRSPQQAIAIGLSKARRAGIPLAPPKPGRTSPATRRKAERDYERGQSSPVKSHRSSADSSKPAISSSKTSSRRTAAKKSSAKKSSARRSRAREAALQREPRSTVSRAALSQQAKRAAKKRSTTNRKSAAKKAARTKGQTGRSTAAKKAAKTRNAKKR